MEMSTPNLTMHVMQYW